MKKLFYKLLWYCAGACFAILNLAMTSDPYNQPFSHSIGTILIVFGVWFFAITLFLKIDPEDI